VVAVGREGGLLKQRPRAAVLSQLIPPDSSVIVEVAYLAWWRRQLAGVASAART
jgi:hypothetical protein